MALLLSHCAGLFPQYGGMFALFFFGGLAGSLTHCAVMCGPVVAGRAACGGCTRISHRLQWHYHAGRILGYGLLGWLSAWIGSQIASIPLWPYLAACILITAGLTFLASSVASSTRTPHRMHRCAPTIQGFMMSFMPCGLLYAALMMAATLHNPWAGMVAMWLFVLGTLPVLCFASASAQLLATRWNASVPSVGRMALAFNGLSLLVIGTNMVR